MLITFTTITALTAATGSHELSENAINPTVPGCGSGYCGPEFMPIPPSGWLEFSAPMHVQFRAGENASEDLSLNKSSIRAW